MEEFPPESRTLIAPALKSVLQCEHCAPGSTGFTGTVRQRIIHFLMFLRAMNLHKTDGEDDWVLEHATQSRVIYTFALYAVHLATGSNLTNAALTSSTIRTYLRNAADFLLAARGGVDPLRVLSSDKGYAPPIAAVMKEIQRWETKADKRDPFTIAMWEWLDNAARDADDTSLEAALRDWTGVGLHAGLRLGEWAQPKSHQGNPKKAPHKNLFGDPAAFCRDDIEFYTAYKRKVPFHEAVHLPPGTITRATIRYRTQKNGQHGERTVFTKARTTVKIDTIELLLSIARRFLTLCGDVPDIPLSVYRDEKGNLRRITETEIVAALRTSAQHVYGLDPHTADGKKALSMWTAHSLRIGACVILHNAGFTDIQIQRLLRWRSDAFTEYLRNLAVLALKQTTAIDEAGAMPNFL